ncbi:zinc finger protein 280C [Nycticebus coucang]|uniref:zinc finger protein 280C n=1 Tax=Nycticebus coucang TaxID=9470 RepID=UPI00234E01ED|nr:zinc finger protein 280C [Nycticebus coucang]
MADNRSFQPKCHSKMAEIFMECEEDVEPWREKEGTEDEDDDELIFVGEISSSKPTISNILNRSNSSSSSKGIKNESLTPGIPEVFRTGSQHYKDSSSSPLSATPKLFADSKSSSSCISQMSKSDIFKNSSPIQSDNSSDLMFDLTQDSIPTSQDIPAIFKKGMGYTPFGSKCSSTEVHSVNSKEPKTSEDISEINPPDSQSVSSTSNSFSLTSYQIMVSKGTNTSSPMCTPEEPLLRACPKCNVQFNLLDPLKCHMKDCCPDMINNFLGNIKEEFSSVENKSETNSEKGKLIMLVSDFYYGKHEGAAEEEQKTYTTFKCFSCLKVLKNNIRFMNHLKHHMELEKQNSEIWENHTTCQHCYRLFPTPFHLQCHIESTHTPHEFSTICKICELSFDTERILLQHMKDTHKPGEMPYICQVCQFRASTFSDVEAHFRASHENTKNLLCPFCLKVSKMATPYMNHYMKHQKKGIHRCTKCRLQFLTCKEKMDHKTQHRTFIKPKELEGLPPGTKVTIRASLGPLQSKLSSTSSSGSSSTSSLQVSPLAAKSLINASKSKISRSHAAASTSNKSSTSKASTCKYKAKSSSKQKRHRNRKNTISIALKNLRCQWGIHKCIECQSKIKDFASHFSIHIHCDFCKYSTNCNKAFINHMMSFHSNHPSKRFHIFKKHSGILRGITLVCLKCDFLTDSSGLDSMAKHLSQRKNHTCQVIIEDVSASTSTSEPTSTCLLK